MNDPRQLIELVLLLDVAHHIDGAHCLSSTGAFVAWIADDVRKESVAELEASGLTWAQVEKAVQQRARAWFLAA